MAACNSLVPNNHHFFCDLLMFLLGMGSSSVVVEDELFTSKNIKSGTCLMDTP